MTQLHAIFRATDGGWQTYSRPDSIYVAGTSLREAQRAFREAAEFHFDEEWPSVSIAEHVEREAAPGIYIRTAIDEKAAARENTAAIIRRSLEVPVSMTITRARALQASTMDIVFVVCEPDDRVAWVTAQLGRVDAVQVCAPLMDEQGMWWMPLATPTKNVPVGDGLTLAAAGLGGDTATVAQLGVWAERQAEDSQTEPAPVDGPFVSAPPLVAA